MTQVINTYTQGGAVHTMNVCPEASEQEYMGDSLSGTVFVASLWGGGGINMEWLDGVTGCSGPANIDGASVTFKNFTL